MQEQVSEDALQLNRLPVQHIDQFLRGSKRGRFFWLQKINFLSNCVLY